MAVDGHAISRWCNRCRERTAEVSGSRLANTKRHCWARSIGSWQRWHLRNESSWMEAQWQSKVYFHYITFSWMIELQISCFMASQLKSVATLSCETLACKNWSKSSLINISCSLSVISLSTGLLYLQASVAVWLYTLRYHIIISDRFCWSLSFPRAVSTLTFCASFTAPSLKVQ